MPFVREREQIGRWSDGATGSREKERAPRRTSNRRKTRARTRKRIASQRQAIIRQNLNGAQTLAGLKHLSDGELELTFEAD